MRTREDEHDTDPAPPPRGNGHDDEERTPSTHAMMLLEVRDAVRAIAGRLDGEIDRRERWEETVSFALKELSQEVRAVRDTLGEPPDPSTGKPGFGMRGQWVAALNAVIRSEARRELPSLSADESEVTQTLDRETLVIAKRKAERDAARARRDERRIKAIAGAAVAIIGAIGAAVAYVLQAAP